MQHGWLASPQDYAEVEEQLLQALALKERWLQHREQRQPTRRDAVH